MFVGVGGNAGLGGGGKFCYGENDDIYAPKKCMIAVMCEPFNPFSTRVSNSWLGFLK